MKPVWKWTHNGQDGEQLCECEGRYYTQFAWDHFLAAYTGRVRPAHRDRPPFTYGEVDFSLVLPDQHPKVGVDSGISISNLWADEEITLEIP